MKKMTVDQYVDHLLDVAKLIESSKDYVTGLDAATGDGDHWININMGFTAIKNAEAELRSLALPDMFRRIGMIMMSVIGGSSGVLYGSAYIAASRVTAGREELDTELVSQVLTAMSEAIMKRGNSKPGDKTMVDSIEPAARAFREGLLAGLPEEEIIENVKRAASDGAEATRGMEAVRGRACYQADRGVGHLDAGAVTMSYQIGVLMDHLSKL